ncbi:hypothetical protein [Streptomyces sp. NPDC058371]|uniref:hypothetical protein n=1 Tax=Streptomyces sp. NPDC058371 TaxID=3346463 RepID=UPI00364DABBA
MEFDRFFSLNPWGFRVDSGIPAAELRYVEFSTVCVAAVSEVGPDTRLLKAPRAPASRFMT